MLEELGIDVPIGRLLAVDWAPHPNEGDKLLFVFDGGQLEDAKPHPASGEIEEVKFWADDATMRVHSASSASVRRRILHGRMGRRLRLG